MYARCSFDPLQVQAFAVNLCCVLRATFRKNKPYMNAQLCIASDTKAALAHGVSRT